MKAFVSPEELDRIRMALRHKTEHRFTGVVVFDDRMCASCSHVIRPGIMSEVVIEVERGGTWKYNGWSWTETWNHRCIRLYHDVCIDKILESEDLDRIRVVA